MNKELKRSNAAIMFSDIVGYTALMGENEDLAFQLIKKNTRIHQEIIGNNGGTLIKELGDGVLSSFPGSQQAVNAAYDLQKHYLRTKELSLRIGIHFGEIIIENNDVFGDSVNIASRLQTLGTPGSILFSDTIEKNLSEEGGLRWSSLGTFYLKNVKDHIEVFALTNEGMSIPTRGEVLKLLESRLKKFMIVAVIFLSLVLAGFWVYHNNYIKQFEEDREKSIAVLPFKNLNLDEDDDYFAEGLTMEIISHLSNISDLKVISKSSSDAYKNTLESNINIAKGLGVNYLVESSIQRKGDLLRIRIDLVDGIGNKTIWGESFEAKKEDVFKLQNDISLKIAETLKAKLSASEKYKLGKEPTQSISAYELYLKGRDYYYKYDLQNNQKAIHQFQKALEIDPDYALAWAGLGDTYSLKHYLTKFDLIWLDSAMYASEKAIMLDSNLSEGYKALSTAYSYKGEHNKSLELLEKALEKNPNNAQAIGNYGTVNFSLGNLEEALVWQKKAAGLNPKLYIPFLHVGWTYRLLGEYDEAVRWLNKSLEKSKDRETYEQLALSYIAINNYDSAFVQIPRLLQLIDTISANSVEEKKLKFEKASKVLESAGIILFYGEEFMKARDYFEQSVQLHPSIANDAWAYSPIYLGYLLKEEKKDIDAEILLEGALYLNMGEVKKQTQDAEHYFHVASIYAIRGEKNESLYYLNEARKKKWVDVFKLSHSPIYSHFKTMPEFKRLIDEINKEIVLMRQNMT